MQSEAALVRSQFFSHLGTELNKQLTV